MYPSSLAIGSLICPAIIRDIMVMPHNPEKVEYQLGSVGPPVLNLDGGDSSSFQKSVAVYSVQIFGWGIGIALLDELLSTINSAEITFACTGRAMSLCMVSGMGVFLDRE